jgi:hypothetical protein
MFTAAKVNILYHPNPTTCSSFYIWVNWNSKNLGSVRCRYECMWERDDTLGSEIKEAWAGGAVVQNLAYIKNNLRYTMKTLKSWSREKFGKVDREIKKLNVRLEWLYNHNPHLHTSEIKSVTARLDELLLRGEMLWRQRSRVTWLKEGDQNTKFFHRRDTWRGKKNNLKSLKTMDDQIIQNKDDILKYTKDYFSALFNKGPSSGSD